MRRGRGAALLGWCDVSLVFEWTHRRIDKICTTEFAGTFHTEYHARRKLTSWETKYFRRHMVTVSYKIKSAWKQQNCTAFKGRLRIYIPMPESVRGTPREGNAQNQPFYSIFVKPCSEQIVAVYLLGWCDVISLPDFGWDPSKYMEGSAKY